MTSTETIKPMADYTFVDYRQASFFKFSFYKINSVTHLTAIFLQIFDTISLYRSLLVAVLLHVICWTLWHVGSRVFRQSYARRLAHLNLTKKRLIVKSLTRLFEFEMLWVPHWSIRPQPLQQTIITQWSNFSLSQNLAEFLITDQYWDSYIYTYDLATIGKS